MENGRGGEKRASLFVLSLLFSRGCWEHHTPSRPRAQPALARAVTPRPSNSHSTRAPQEVSEQPDAFFLLPWRRRQAAAAWACLARCFVVGSPVLRWRIPPAGSLRDMIFGNANLEGEARDAMGLVGRRRAHEQSAPVPR